MQGRPERYLLIGGIGGTGLGGGELVEARRGGWQGHHDVAADALRRLAGRTTHCWHRLGRGVEARSRMRLTKVDGTPPNVYLKSTRVLANTRIRTELGRAHLL